MAIKGISGVAVAGIGIGTILLLSGYKGKNVSDAFRRVLAGQSPLLAASANPIVGTSTQGAMQATPSMTSGIAQGPTNSSISAWAVAQLKDLGAPVTQANINSLAAWQRIEGGNWENTAHYNPLNTTLRAPGSSPMNSVGVQSYTSWNEGIRATTLTLEQGYPAIVARLRSGQGLLGWASQEFLTWSGGGYSAI